MPLSILSASCVQILLYTWFIRYYVCYYVLMRQVCAFRAILIWRLTFNHQCSHLEIRNLECSCIPNMADNNNFLLWVAMVIDCKLIAISILDVWDHMIKGVGLCSEWYNKIRGIERWRCLHTSSDVIVNTFQMPYPSHTISSDVHTRQAHNIVAWYLIGGHT